MKNLLNLGPASAKMLARINIHNLHDLKARGAINCYLDLLEHQPPKPGLNLLYALLGALKNKPWQSFKKQKGELMIRLEQTQELRKIWREEKR